MVNFEKVYQICGTYKCNWTKLIKQEQQVKGAIVGVSERSGLSFFISSFYKPAS